MIEAILKKGTKGDAERRGCHDCGWCMGAVSWWCKNEDAIKARGSRFPTVGRGCPYWESCRSVDDLSLRERIALPLNMNQIVVDTGIPK